MAHSGPETTDPYSRLYQSLIGNEDLRQALKTYLGVFIGSGKRAGINPYLVMNGKVVEAVNITAHDISRNIEGQYSDFAQKVQRNSSGISMVVSGLVTVGSIYQSRAQVPQKHEVVSANARRAVSYLNRIAFMKGATATLNLQALHYANDPKSIRPRIFTPRPLHDLVHNDAFVTSADDQGQLTIRPRYPLLQDDSGQRCPASHDMMRVDEKTQNSLLTLLNIVADATVEYIYPAEFPMLPPEMAQ